MKNIFQGNSSITNAIAKGLEYETPQKYSWFTQDIYHAAFFYLYKRFGEPNQPHDDGKEAGAWSFKYKQYIFHFRFASWVEIMMFSERETYKRTYFSQTAYRTKYYREQKRLLSLSYIQRENDTLEQKEFYEFHWQTFLKNNDIGFVLKPKGDYSEEEVRSWMKYVDSINEKKHQQIEDSIDKDFYERIEAEHGNENSETRHALRALNKVLREFMEEPVWIRDVPHNIKGVMKESALKRRASIDIKLKE